MVSTTTTERTRRLLASLPDSPGVYVFRESRRQGSLRGQGQSRCASGSCPTFAKSSLMEDNPRISRMLRRMRDFDFVVTASETEALLLESNFIKHHRPPFNVMLRDDKSYPYVAITLDEKFPRVMITRKRHRSGVAYFGPFASAGKVREIIDLLGRIYPYRKCRGPEPGRRTGSPVSTITSVSAWRLASARLTPTTTAG